jgi:hypothetical protein
MENKFSRVEDLLQVFKHNINHDLIRLPESQLIFESENGCDAVDALCMSLHLFWGKSFTNKKYITKKRTEMARINLQDSITVAVAKMVDGNMGAMTALMDILKYGRTMDADDLGGLQSLLFLDTLGIYGTDIYVLWSDICERNTAKMIAVLCAVQYGMFPAGLLKDACHRQDYSGKEIVPVDDLYGKIKERHPLFEE